MASGKKRQGDSRSPISVLIEFRQLPGSSGAFMASVASQLDVPGCTIDHRFEPVPMGGGLTLATGAGTFVVRAEVGDMSVVEALRARPDVVDVWIDTPIAPFETQTERDCSPGEPKGNLADVANYLGATDLWVRGYYGEGVVVGIVDGGITAQARQVKDGETRRRIGRVIGGWPEVDWGTEASRWDEHGNMCATAVLGIAPRAQLYDLRIGGAGGTSGTLSRALQAFQWAIDRHRLDGTPQVLSNSWGIYQQAWDANYAGNPNHPFTRKVGEAVEEGIVVLFAAGNCGADCPPAECGRDSGPGRSPTATPRSSPSRRSTRTSGTSATRAKGRRLSTPTSPTSAGSPTSTATSGRTREPRPRVPPSPASPRCCCRALPLPRPRR